LAQPTVGQFVEKEELLMSRFNNKSTPVVGGRSGVQTTGETVVNHAGRVGYGRDVKGELFLLAASFMGGDDNFYEKSQDRYERLQNLIANVVAEEGDDTTWLLNFVTWLRKDANLRTVAMVIAVETARTRLMTDKQGGNRDLINAALQRADEPGEALAYWLSNYGKPIPWPIKNGIADAAIRLYNEFSFLKYGKNRNKSVSMKDVLRITRPTPGDAKQSALFSYIIDPTPVPVFATEFVGPGLPVIAAREKLAGFPKERRREILASPVGQALLKEAGFTWENLSEYLPGGMDAEAWELAISNMNIMALIRNLRNFDEAGINKLARNVVRAKINPQNVRDSKQLPFRWYQAYRATDSLHYVADLEDALDLSLENIPKLKGKTLVLVDMSGSMFQGNVSERSVVTYADAASLFGAALKLRNPDGVDLYQYGSNYHDLSLRYYSTKDHRPFAEYRPNERWTGVTKRIDLNVGSSVLRSMEKFQDMGGTQTQNAVAETITPEHDRVIIITDEQAFQSRVDYTRLGIPAGKSLYVWNLAGYKAGLVESGKYKTHVFGGLNDAAFQMIPLLETGKSVGWPWEVKTNG
jgi:hypothetical protein